MATLLIAGPVETGITTGKYTLIRQADGFWWNTSGTPAFEAYNAANIASYGIAATETGATGIYTATNPSDTTPAYFAFVKAAGASLAVADLQTGLRWTGNTGPLPTSAVTLATAQPAVTFTSLSVTGAFAIAGGIAVTQSATNGNGISVTGNGTGKGFLATGGATGDGMYLTGGGTSGNGLYAKAIGISTGGAVFDGGTANAGLYLTGNPGLYGRQAATNGAAMQLQGSGTGSGLLATGGTTGAAIQLTGGVTSGDGLSITTSVGHGVNIAASGASKHGIFATGGTSGVSDGMNLTAGTGGVALRATAITGTLSNVTLVDTTTNLTNAPTAGDFTATMKTSLNAATPASTGSITGDVSGKVLGGGASTITGTGVRAVDSSGNAIAPAATALSTAVWIAPPAGFLAATFPATVSGLTQTQVTGGAYALNSASFGFNSALDFTTAQKAATLARVTLVDTTTNLTNNTPTIGNVTLADGSLTTAKFAAGATIPRVTLADTATNLTNAPTGGDFTAAMKTSLNAATPSVTVSDKTGFSLSASQTFNLTGNITGNLSGSVGSVTAGVTVTTNSDKTGYSLTVTPPTAAQTASAVWDESLAGHTTSGTSGAVLTFTKDFAEGDEAIDSLTTPWDSVVFKKGTLTELTRKVLRDIDGTGIADVGTVIASAKAT